MFRYCYPMPTRIVIDPGHGGWDPGASSAAFAEEKHFTLLIALALRGALAPYDVEILLTRTEDRALAPGDDLSVELKARADVANQVAASLLLSLHHDASSDPALRGGSLWIWTSALTQSGGLRWLPADGNHTDPLTFPLAVAMAPHLRQTLSDMGIPWRSLGDPNGVACANFGILRNTKGAAMIFECFLGTSDLDNEVMARDGSVQQLARGIAAALVAALDLRLRHPMVVLPSGERIQGELREGVTWARIGGVDLPVRPVAEALGLRVEWEATTRTVSLIP